MQPSAVPGTSVTVKDYRTEKYFRDAEICTIGEGTSEIQRMVIARSLLRG